MIGTKTANAVLDNLFRAGVYVSLHQGPVGEDGAYEIIDPDGKYARQLAGFDVAADRMTTNSGTITFQNLPGVRLFDFGIWDAETGGTFLWGGSFDAERQLNAADTFQINPRGMKIYLK